MTAARRRLRSRARTDFLTPSQGIEQLLADVRSVPGTVRQGALSTYDFIEEDPERAALLGALVSPDPYVGTLAGITEAFGYYPDPFNPDKNLPSVEGSLREGDYVGAGLTSLGALPIVGGLFGAAKAARLAKAAQMGEDPSALTIEGDPPLVAGGGGDSAPTNVPSNTQIKAKKRELGEAAKKAKSPSATQEEAARFEELKSELAEMQRLQKDAKPTADPVDLVPSDRAGISDLGTRTKGQPSRTEFPIEVDNERPINTQVSTAVSRGLDDLKLPKGNLSGEEFEKLLLKQKGVNKVAYDQSGLRKLIDENRDNPNFIGSRGDTSRLYTVDDLMNVVKQKSPRIGLTRLTRTNYEGMQRPDFNLNQVIPAPKEEEIAFTLTARYPDQPSNVSLVSASHGGVSSENAVLHTRVIPGRYNPNHINDPDGPYLPVDIIGELQGDRAVRTLAERNKDRGIASLDKANVLQNARRRYSERKDNYGQTVRNTFNTATENSPTARRVFSEYISPSGVNPDATDQETDLVAGLMYFIDTELGPDVTPQMVRRQLDDLERSLDDPDFVGTADDRIREGLMPGRPLARLDEGVSVDAEDFFRTMKSEDGVQAIVEMANDRANTAFVFDDIRLAATEVNEAVGSIGRAEANLSSTGAKDILDRDAIELLDVDAQAYRDKKVKVDDLESAITVAKNEKQNELFRSAKFAIFGPLRNELPNTVRSYEIRMRETFPDISDTTDNPLGDAARYFFDAEDKSLDGALDFISGGSNKSLDDMIAAADDPIAARALVNQFRSDLVKGFGFGEDALQKYRDDIDSIAFMDAERLEAIDELNTEKARLLQKFGTQEGLDTGLKQIDDLAERELLVDPPFSSIAEGFSQTSQAFLSEFLATRVVDELLLPIANTSGSIEFFDIPANPITKLKEGVIFPSGSIQAQAHNFTRSKELTNQYNVGQKTAIDAFTESNPGVFTVEEIVLDAPRAAGADTDTSYFVRLTPEYKQKVADVIQEISDEYPDPFSTKQEFLRIFQEKMTANTSDVKLKFAKGGAVKIHDGIGAMAREVL